MADIRILSYLPNPRVWKALIAAELCGVEVEVVGDAPPKMPTWLWDFDARELSEAERTDDSPHARISRRGFSGTLFKTDAFLEAHPFGTVPAAFSGDGSVGIFESNSILRAVVRAATDDAGLYGKDAFEASRIDSFLDTALVFAREAQVYLLAASEMDATIVARMAGAYEFFLNGIEAARELALHRRARAVDRGHRYRVRSLAVPARATHGRSSRLKRLRADQRRSRE